MAAPLKKKKQAAPDTPPATVEEDPPAIENYADDPTSDLYVDCLEYYPKIQKAYENREDADHACKEYWSIYNAEPDDNQSYNGNSKCYVPVVRDCINSRAKRALKQAFPNRFKHVDAVGSDSLRPQPQLALLEHYIRTTKLKSIVRSSFVAGDVTGQWNLYVDWLRTIRNVTGMITRNPIIEELGEPDPVEKEEVKEDKQIVDESPLVIDFATEDLAVVPPTCNDIEQAELVSLKLRMSKSQVKEMVDKGIFIISDDTELSDWVDDHKGKEKTNPPKRRTSDAGIKTEGTNKYALIYEITARLDFDDDGKKSLAYIYFAGEKELLGIIRAPQWGQRRPTLSAPVDRVGGSFYGVSKIEAVKYMQWNLNDFWNMGQDSAMYSLLPIVMTDPEKNPNYAMMVFGLAAVWPTNPNDTQFAAFPQLWKDSIGMCNSIKGQIQESMDVNPMMMGQMPAGRKNAQAMGAQQQEQSVPILDHAERYEEEMLTPLMERFFEYDAQFREDEVTVRTMGEIGIKASMMVIPPQEWGQRYSFEWIGTTYVKNMQMMQQQIATMNVLRGIPPQQLNGRRLDIAPILEILTDNVFGAELSGRILIDDRIKYSVPAEIEDEMMVNGMMIDVHEADDDLQHMQDHMKSAQATGDPAGLMRTHVQAHVQQLQKKRQMAMGEQQQMGGQPGVPGGAGPGVAGTPRPGAQPEQPRQMQQPAGAINPDQLAGGVPRG
jgi:hypothetical protein